MRATPERYRRHGLRPGGERPALEPFVQNMYAALYELIATHSRLGINVIAEFGHHAGYSRPLGIRGLCPPACRPAGVFVGVRCSLDVIMARRNAGQTENSARYEMGTAEEPIPAPVQRFQNAVHVPGIYDLEVDTSLLSPAESAALIRKRLGQGIPLPSAFDRLRALPD